MKYMKIFEIFKEIMNDEYYCDNIHMFHTTTKENLEKIKLDGCKIALVPFPTNKEFEVKETDPVPPYATFKVPAPTLLVFKLVKEDPAPENIGADNILLVNVKLFGVIKLPVLLPTNKELLKSVFNPVPP